VLNFAASKKFAERFDTVVTVFPDGYPKYQSIGLTQNQKDRCPYRREQQIDCLLK